MSDFEDRDFLDEEEELDEPKRIRSRRDSYGEEEEDLDREEEDYRRSRPMKRRRGVGLITGILLFIILVWVIMWLLGRMNIYNFHPTSTSTSTKTTTTTTNPSTKTQTKTATSISTTAGSGNLMCPNDTTIMVTIPLNAATRTMDSYQPEPIRACATQLIQWTNMDMVAHSVTADDLSFDSGIIMPFNSYSIALPAGTYSYHCSLHPNMRGTIIVQ